MQTKYTEIVDWLKDGLTPERYSHSIGVAEQAKKLAPKYNLDPEKLYLAGLLHDCAKHMSNDELLAVIKEHIPSVDVCQLKNYKTLHAPVGAYLAREVFKVHDEEILSAIYYHTLGRVDMSDFEAILFIADKIEGNTRDPIFQEEILGILNDFEGRKGIDRVLLVCFEKTIISLVKRNLQICTATIDVYNSLLERVCVL